MSDDSAPEIGPRYRAFISYSHADARLAGWLHRKLEARRLPDNQRLTPIFIDRAELAAGPDLTAQVREALAQSAALVVVASPAARASRWVEQEVLLFRQLHPGRPVLAALIAGEPAEAFPQPLLEYGGKTMEPLAADFREGQDGKRLGLLKIAAGLSGQPLDRLIQRDAQSRQRRVMTVTAGALILSLVLAGLLAVAIRARNEAERQRAEAEGLVEYMLTDLRDKLKGVGRLDVMDSVNQRVTRHYAGDADLSSQPRDILLRRTVLLQSMAEDDMRSAERMNLAEKEAREAWRITDSLLQRSPSNPDVIFAHARSEYMLGYHAFLSKGPNGGRDLDKARTHFSAYSALARRLVDLEPRKAKWQEELAYSEGSLCAMALEKPINADAAARHCRLAREAMERAARLEPDSLDAQLALANRFGWEADAWSAVGNQPMALASRQRQAEVTHGAGRFGANNAQVVEAEMLAKLGLARAQRSNGNSRAALASARDAKALAERLVRLDPENRDWAAWLKAIEKDTSENEKR